MFQPKTGNRCTCRPRSRGEWSGAPNPANPDNEWICDDCGRTISALRALGHRINRCACCGESFHNGESGSLCYPCRGAA